MNTIPLGGRATDANGSLQSIIGRRSCVGVYLGTLWPQPDACYKLIMLALAGRYGSWGVCFTYGTWFGIEALAAVGESIHSSAVSTFYGLPLSTCRL